MSAFAGRRQNDGAVAFVDEAAKAIVGIAASPHDRKTRARLAIHQNRAFAIDRVIRHDLADRVAGQEIGNGDVGVEENITAYFADRAGAHGQGRQVVNIQTVKGDVIDLEGIVARVVDHALGVAAAIAVQLFIAQDTARRGGGRLLHLGRKLDIADHVGGRRIGVEKRVGAVAANNQRKGAHGKNVTKHPVYLPLDLFCQKNPRVGRKKQRKPHSGHN